MLCEEVHKDIALSGPEDDDILGLPDIGKDDILGLPDIGKDDILGLPDIGKLSLSILE